MPKEYNHLSDLGAINGASAFLAKPSKVKKPTLVNVNRSKQSAPFLDNSFEYTTELSASGVNKFTASLAETLLMIRVGLNNTEVRSGLTKARRKVKEKMSLLSPEERESKVIKAREKLMKIGEYRASKAEKKTLKLLAIIESDVFSQVIVSPEKISQMIEAEKTLAEGEKLCLRVRLAIRVRGEGKRATVEVGTSFQDSVAPLADSARALSSAENKTEALRAPASSKTLALFTTSSSHSREFSSPEMINQPCAVDNTNLSAPIFRSKKYPAIVVSSKSPPVASNVSGLFTASDFGSANLANSASTGKCSAQIVDVMEMFEGHIDEYYCSVLSPQFTSTRFTNPKEECDNVSREDSFGASFGASFGK